MCATLGGAPPTARPSKCLIACVARARSGAPTHTAPQKRHARELSTRRDASRDPFALKRCVLQNMRHTKLLAERPTSRPSKSIILSVTRVVSGASTHTCTQNTPHAYFGPAQTPPWTPLHSKCAHNIRHLRERAHLLDERATSRPSKGIMSSAAPVLSGVLMHTCP